MRRFCDQFASRRIRLFLTLREPAAFLASMYCEYLRHNPCLGFADYARGFDLEGFSYAEVFDWLGALPRHVAVTVTPFESARGGGVRVITERLLAAACGPSHGIDPGRFPGPARGPPTAARSSASPRRSPGAPTPKTAQIFLNMLNSRDRRFGATRFEPLPPERAAALAARYDRDLAAFAGLRRPEPGRGPRAAEPDRRGLDPRRAGARARRRGLAGRAGVDYLVLVQEPDADPAARPGARRGWRRGPT